MYSGLQPDVCGLQPCTLWQHPLQLRRGEARRAGAVCEETKQQRHAEVGHQKIREQHLRYRSW